MTQSARSPRVVIGVPVHNGGPSIGESLNSALSQVLDDQRPVDLACVVSENWSTDDTAEVVAELSAQDKRLHVVQPDALLAAPLNFLFAFEAARALEPTHFSWLAADDLFPPGYIASAMACAAESTAEFVVSNAEFFFEETGEVLKVWRPTRHVSSPSTFRRLLGYATQARWNEIYSLYTPSTFDVLATINNQFGFDALLTWRLLLRGPAAQLDSIGSRYAVRSDGPKEPLKRIRYKLGRALNGRPPDWFMLWRAFWTAAGEQPDRSTRRTARCALLIAACHPRWLKKFGDEIFRRSVRFVARRKLHD